MPRDEPVGSLGRLAFKPTEFREQRGLIRLRLLHDAPPCFDDSEATNSFAKQVPHRGAGEDQNGALLGVSGSALAPDCPAERVAKGASSIAISPWSHGLISSRSVSIQAFRSIRWFDRN